MWLARVLVGRISGETVPDAAEIVAIARAHRVHLLLASCLPPDFTDLRSKFAAEVHGAVAREAVLGPEIGRVARACAKAGVRPLLLKGTALAYSVYQQPWMRPRADVDLLVAEADVGRVKAVASALGYVPAHELDTPLVTRQVHLSRDAGAGIQCHLDVHWRVLNSTLLEHALTYEDAAVRAVPVPALGEPARALDPADALFLAALHRVVHHREARSLLWLYDIHLLAVRLSDEQWRRLAETCERRGARRLVAASLAAASACFGTGVPAEAMEALNAPADEASTVYLGGGLRQIDLEILNLRHAAGWRARAALLVQHLLPPPSYMLQKYGARSPVWLPWLYGRRIVAGVPRWFRRITPGGS